MLNFVNMLSTIPQALTAPLRAAPYAQYTAQKTPEIITKAVYASPAAPIMVGVNALRAGVTAPQIVSASFGYPDTGENHAGAINMAMVAGGLGMAAAGFIILKTRKAA